MGTNETSHLGLGVMIRQLFGSDARSAEVFSAALEKVITDLSCDGEALHFTFKDGSKVRIADEGQSCCESRYMTTDGDDLSYFVGAKLLGATIESAPEADEEYDWDSHEVQFLHVRTDRGIFTVSSHNEHNGYYGGFSLEASEA